jgi:acetyl esterase/lipase
MRVTWAVSLVIGLSATWPAGGGEKPEVLALWPGKVPDETAAIGAEKGVMSPKLDRKQVEVTESTRMVTNVSKPSITVYRPAKGKDTGTAVVICPGGGYWNLYWELEGEEVAAWLNSLGVTGIVLKYRVPRRPDEPKGEPARRPLQDAQRAVRLVRSKAREWGIDPQRIGMIGFSAGGHLAIATATNFEKPAYPPIDDLDQISCRPDFAILVYPGYLKAKDRDELASGLHIPKGTPSVFLAHGDDDLISPAAHSVVLYRALRRAGVPAELHVYTKTAHDFGVRHADRPYSSWTRSCTEWLRQQGFLPQPMKNPATSWKNGLPTDVGFFPVAVWLQSPANAARYKAAGINVYVGLWKGPTEDHLAELKKHGLRVICSQNAVGLRHKDDPTIVGWMHGDEPDNAQALPGKKGYGQPILPSKIVADYRELRRADSSRPILLNLGQGVAWDKYHGRGVRSNHPEDYPEYIQGCDIVSYDIYPGCHDHPDVAGKLWMVADGVTRLRKWTDNRQTVWNCIECTRISNVKARATPQQVRAEVWMSLVRGSSGLIYFAHQFKPKFIEAGLLADEAMLAEVTATNRQIHRLAPVLNSPVVKDGVAVQSSAAEVPVEAVARRHDGAVYVFAVAMRDGTATVTFKLPGMRGQAIAEVLDERRTLEVRDGIFRDTFRPWEVHLYKITSS